MAVKVPTPADVRSMFCDLLDRDVTVSPADPAEVADLSHLTIAVYTDPRLQLAGVLALDLRLAVYAGAALGLVPAGGAADYVEAKELPDPLAENVRELCNVFTGLLNREGSPHLSLNQFVRPGEPVAPDVTAQVLAFGSRLDLAVEVNRYGSGRLFLSLAC